MFAARSQRALHELGPRSGERQVRCRDVEFIRVLSRRSDNLSTFFGDWFPTKYKHGKRSTFETEGVSLADCAGLEWSINSIPRFFLMIVLFLFGSHPAS